ncbi:peroxisomal membrane protein 2 [Orussus abietinus]|uniref:peroxisomal membrane protein 2 n=1 Tax=Orussus abietinus TaxID=222816 RepID=UPI00062597E9|nr:peroxisomal membrane protein 2 [Orussus abietinus]
MGLSKPSHVIQEIVAAYLQRLYTSPVKTKAATSCVITALGNLTGQKLSNVKFINQDSLMAFGLFGLLFGGTVPHYFYKYVRLITKNPWGILLIERLLYTPIFQGATLYLLAWLEGKSHEASMKQTQSLYVPVLAANLKYLTLLQFLNIKYVPPMLHVLVLNLISYFWTTFLAHLWIKSMKDRSSSKVSKKT